jgi:hypothetical protein
MGNELGVMEIELDVLFFVVGVPQGFASVGLSLTIFAQDKQQQTHPLIKRRLNIDL